MSKLTQKISAVHDLDLERVLEELGLYSEVQNGKIRCVFCNKVICLGNIQYIFSKNEKIVISCDSQDCLEKAKQFLSRA